jgi:DNA-binding PadR family transcriptional regulator
MPSTLGYALLGLLARHPRTGYELSRAMREPVGFFWTARHSQIYPELAKLEESGLIGGKAEHGPGPRENRRYSIRAAGRRALSSWVTSTTSPEPSRSVELLKVYSLWLADPSGAREVLTQQREQHRRTLEQYDALAATFADEGPSEPGSARFFDEASVQRGRSVERATVEWFDWLLRATD